MPLVDPITQDAELRLVGAQPLFETIISEQPEQPEQLELLE